MFGSSWFSWIGSAVTPRSRKTTISQEDDERTSTSSSSTSSSNLSIHTQRDNADLGVIVSPLSSSSSMSEGELIDRPSPSEMTQNRATTTPTATTMMINDYKTNDAPIDPTPIERARSLRVDVDSSIDLTEYPASSSSSTTGDSIDTIEPTKIETTTIEKAPSDAPIVPGMIPIAPSLSTPFKIRPFKLLPTMTMKQTSPPKLTSTSTSVTTSSVQPSDPSSATAPFKFSIGSDGVDYESLLTHMVNRTTMKKTKEVTVSMTPSETNRYDLKSNQTTETKNETMTQVDANDKTPLRLAQDTSLDDVPSHTSSNLCTTKVDDSISPEKVDSSQETPLDSTMQTATKTSSSSSSASISSSSSSSSSSRLDAAQSILSERLHEFLPTGLENVTPLTELKNEFEMPPLTPPAPAWQSALQRQINRSKLLPPLAPSDARRILPPTKATPTKESSSASTSVTHKSAPKEGMPGVIKLPTQTIRMIPDDPPNHLRHHRYDTPTIADIPLALDLLSSASPLSQFLGARMLRKLSTLPNDPPMMRMVEVGAAEKIIRRCKNATMEIQVRRQKEHTQHYTCHTCADRRRRSS